MIILTVNNSFSRIQGLNPKQEAALRKALSYVVGGSSSYFSGYGPRRKSLLDKRGGYPTGLQFRVIKFLNDQGTNFEVKDLRVRPK